MNKSLVILGFLMILVCGVVGAVTETSNLNCGNNVCERYSHVFKNIGETTSLSAEGKTLDVKLLTKSTSNSVAQWDVNGVQGETSMIWNNYFHPDRKNFDYAVRLESSVKYDVYDYMGEEIYLKEEQYCESDCILDNQTDNWVFWLNVKPGWNLLNVNKIGFSNCNMVKPGIICKDDIAAQFVYVPSLKKYVNVDTVEQEYSSVEVQKIQNEITGFTSSFVYLKDSVKSKKATTIFFKGQSPEFQGFNLTAGWNFISITQDMYAGNWNPSFGNEGEYFSFDRIKGNCNYEKIAIWNSEKQEWYVLDSTTKIKSYDFDEFLNLGVVVRVSSDCKLGTVVQQINPPAMP